MRELLIVTVLALLGCGGAESANSTGAGGTGGTTTAGGSAGAGGTGGGTTGSGGTGGEPAPDLVKVVVEPFDNASGLLQAISGAQTSVHMTMYLLTLQSVTDALIAQKKKGRDVQVILNKSFPQGMSNVNQTAYSALSAAGVPVHWASAKFTYTHEKCVIIDQKVAWIMTMNLTNSSIKDNREMLAIDSNPDDVAEAEAIFQADFKDAAIAATGPLVVAPDNARQALLNLVNGAKKSIDIEAEELSDDKLTAALTGLVANGVAVRVVLSDQTPTMAEQQSIDLLKQHKIPVVQVASPYIHTKTILVDGVRAYVGSANLTFYSLTANRELGVIITAPDAISLIAGTIDKDFKVGKAF